MNGLVDLPEPAAGFTVIGAGKTAMDACGWLLDNGISPQAIRWVRPRDAWILDRAYSQPLDLVPMLIEGVARNLEAGAEAANVEDLFARLESNGQLMRIDQSVEPSMYRCATLSQSEFTSLRQITNVVRTGRVRHIGSDSIELEEGSIPTDSGQIHVDLRGLRGYGDAGLGPLSVDGAIASQCGGRHRQAHGEPHDAVGAGAPNRQLGTSASKSGPTRGRPWRNLTAAGTGSLNRACI